MPRLTMVYKLAGSAQKRWRKLRGDKKLSVVWAGTQFKDGVELETAAQPATGREALPNFPRTTFDNIARVLAGPAVVTSGRKFHWHGPLGMLGHLVLLSIPGAVRVRALCRLW